MYTRPRQAILVAIYNAMRDAPRSRGLARTALSAQLGGMDEFDLTYLKKKGAVEEANGLLLLSASGIDEAEAHLMFDADSK